MTRTLRTLGLLTSAVVFTACGRPASSGEPPRMPGEPGNASESAAYGGGAKGAYARPEAAPAPAAAPAQRSSSGAEEVEGEAPATAKADEAARPGLGTSWGETRSSRVSSTSFERDDGDSPFASATFFYNDGRGVDAMNRGRFVDWSESVASLPRGITVSITEPGGSPLRAARVGSRTYAVGRDGDRYVIHVQNRSPVRIEAVATVDGLDVMNGDDGALSNRGYVIAPYDSLEIEGFRESDSTVRAFRFGATDESYATRRGKGRNVGVIGVALFSERGSDYRWTPEEMERRQTAEPFPARFAPPPPSWHAR